MEIFSYLGLTASFMCAILSIVVFLLNRKALLNMLFTAAALFGAYWAFTEAMMWQASSPENAFVWERSAFLWPFFVVFSVHFALVFTESKLARGKFPYLILYTPAVAFALISLATDQLYGSITRHYWGYVALYSDTWITPLTGLWSGGLSIFAAVITIRYYLKVKDKTKKLQAKCIAIGLSIPVIAYSTTNIVFPRVGIEIPNLGNISTGILISLVAYAMWKYELFSINPALAAENIISTMPDSLVLADLKGKIIKVNRALINFSEYAEMELIDRPILDLFLDNQKGIIVLNELTEKRKITNLETQFKTKAGKEKTVTISASIVENNRGQDIGITCIIHDITYRKLMEEKLLKTERFASIGELASMIGHDLRNPLTSIRGATYYLKNKYANQITPTENEMFKTIERSIAYSDKIITDLLDYSRVIKLELETVTPKALLKNVFSIVQAPENVVINDLTKDSPEIKVDSSKIIRVFANIVKNAFDSMPNGGSLSIMQKKNNKYVAIYFKDTGEGMSEDTLSKLWIPLFTTKAKGMGFGLSICKRIIEAHGGKISAESTIGKGSIIIVTLPLDSRIKEENNQMFINQPQLSLSITDQT